MNLAVAALACAASLISGGKTAVVAITTNEVLVNVTFEKRTLATVRLTNLAIGPREVYIFPRWGCFANGIATPDKILHTWEGWTTRVDTAAETGDGVPPSPYLIVEVKGGGAEGMKIITVPKADR